MTNSKTNRIGKPIRPKEPGSMVLRFTGGAKLKFSHEQDCCEHNYPDFISLDSTGFWDQDFDSIHVETFYGGIRISGYSLNCYSEQNGYYSNDLTVTIMNEDEYIADLTLTCGSAYY